MIPLVFLGLAVAIPLVGIAVVFFVNWLRRDRWEDGMKAFEQRRRALADASSVHSTSNVRFERETPPAS